MRVNKPKAIAIVDLERPLHIDIDGDRVPDLTHSDYMKRLILSNSPKANVDIFTASEEQLATTLEKVGSKSQYTDVIFSVSSDTVIRDYSINDDVLWLKSKNLREHGLTLKNTLKEPPSSSPSKIIDALEELSNRQKTVWVGGGNRGENSFNLYNLAEGSNIRHLKAVNPQGDVEPYSANNNLLNTSELGTFVTQKLAGGFDIDSNGTVDVLFSEVSGGSSKVSNFHQKPMAQVLASPQEMEELRAMVKALKKDYKTTLKQTEHVDSMIQTLQQKLFPLEFLADLKLVSQSNFKNFETLGPYASGMHTEYHLGLPRINIAISPGFRERGGLAVYDPTNTQEDHEGVPVSYHYGTSFVAPHLLGKG